MKPVEEGIAELGERPELLLGVDDEGVAGNDAVVVAMHYCDEPETKVTVQIFRHQTKKKTLLY